jgi:hypothetical protein
MLLISTSQKDMPTTKASIKATPKATSRRRTDAEPVRLFGGAGRKVERCPMPIPFGHGYIFETIPRAG